MAATQMAAIASTDRPPDVLAASPAAPARGSGVPLAVPLVSDAVVSCGLAKGWADGDALALSDGSADAVGSGLALADCVAVVFAAAVGLGLMLAVGDSDDVGVCVALGDGVTVVVAVSSEELAVVPSLDGAELSDGEGDGLALRKSKRPCSDCVESAPRCLSNVVGMALAGCKAVIVRRHASARVSDLAVRELERRRGMSLCLSLRRMIAFALGSFADVGRPLLKMRCAVGGVGWGNRRRGWAYSGWSNQCAAAVANWGMTMTTVGCYRFCVYMCFLRVQCNPKIGFRTRSITRVGMLANHWPFSPLLYCTSTPVCPQLCQETSHCR